MRLSKLIGVGILLLAGGLAVLGLRHLGGSERKALHTITVETERFAREVPAEGYLKAEKATPIGAPRGRTPLRIAWIKENGSTVEKGEVVVRFDRDDFKRNLADGQSQMKVAGAKLASERAQIKNAAQSRSRKAALAEMDLTRSRARADEQDDSIFSRNEILTSRIDGKLSEARVEHANGANRIDHSIARSKIKLLELEEKGAELAIRRAEEGLARMEVTAPHEGIFVYDNSGLKAGDSIYPGQSFAKLPLVETMEAEVFVLEADAMGLEEGKSATLVLESQPTVSYAATVKQVDSLAKPRQREVPIQYFSVILSLEKTDTAVMKPGQRVQAVLGLESLEAIVVPRQCIFEVDGDMIAYRLADGSFEAVEVALGPGTPGRVVVEEGLVSGDAIATRDPYGRTDTAEEDDESEAAQGMSAP